MSLEIKVEWEDKEYHHLRLGAAAVEVGIDDLSSTGRESENQMTEKNRACIQTNTHREYRNTSGSSRASLSSTLSLSLSLSLSLPDNRNDACVRNLQ